MFRFVIFRPLNLRLVHLSNGYIFRHYSIQEFFGKFVFAIFQNVYQVRLRLVTSARKLKMIECSINSWPNVSGKLFQHVYKIFRHWFNLKLNSHVDNFKRLPSPCHFILGAKDVFRLSKNYLPWNTLAYPSLFIVPANTYVVEACFLSTFPTSIEHYSTHLAMAYLNYFCNFEWFNITIRILRLF